MSDELTGGCQCGAVRYRVEGSTPPAYVCHCRECQKQSASAFGISVAVFKASLTVSGKMKSWRRSTDSGSFTDCYFCPKCGTRIYHAGHNRPNMVTIKGGSLDGAQALRPVAHIWTASKQDWVELAGSVPEWERQPSSKEEWAQLLMGGR